MVTTRSSTNSLPVKRAVESEPQAPERKKKRATSSTNKKRTFKKKSANSDPAPVEPESDAISNTLMEPGRKTTFFDLPPELRNDIYSRVINQRKISILQSQTYINEPAIAAVNRQIRNEALSMWYGEQIFEIQGSSPAMKFLRSLANEKLKLLRTIHIQVMIVSSIDYARGRIKQLVREFGPLGLSKHAIHFQVIQNGQLVWSNLEDLKHMVEDEEQRPNSSRDGRTQQCVEWI